QLYTENRQKAYLTFNFPRRLIALALSRLSDYCVAVFRHRSVLSRVHCLTSLWSHFSSRSFVQPTKMSKIVFIYRVIAACLLCSLLVSFASAYYIRAVSLED